MPTADVGRGAIPLFYDSRFDSWGCSLISAFDAKMSEEKSPLKRAFLRLFEARVAAAPPVFR